MKKPVILKLGGSAITNKNQLYTLAPKKKLQRIFKEIASYSGPLVVISGGGSFGHPAVLDKGLETAQGASFVRQKMEILRIKLVEYFLDNNLPVHNFSPYSIGIVKRGKVFEGPLRRKVEITMDRGEIPFTSGDVVKDVKKSYVVLSGDDQAVYLANALEAERLVMVLNDTAEGIHPTYPINREPPLKRLTKTKWNQIKSLYRSYEKKNTTADVTGGIFGKIDLLFKVTPNTEAVLVGSQKKHTVKKALTDGTKAIKTEEILGTIIPAEERISEEVAFAEKSPF